MASEGFPNSSLPPEEQARVNDAYKEADPTTYSAVELQGELTELGKAVEAKENRLFSSDGEKYVRLERGDEDAAQFVTAKLLKGIMNVSDVVRDTDGTFYSKVMPLEKIQEETSKTEMDANLFVIKALTGDGDRDFEPAKDGREQYVKNLVHEDGKVAYFDFGNARDLNTGTNSAEQARYTGTEALHRADEKLDSIYRRLNGSMGTLFLKAVIKESGSSTGDVFPAFRDADSDEESTILALQATLLNKINVARSEIQKRLGIEWERAA